MLEQLGETPASLADAVTGAPSKRLKAPPEPGEWSAVEILAASPRRWRRLAEYAALDFAPSLDAFTTQRGDLLGVLRPLRPAGWKRNATMTGAGRPLQRSVFDFAERLAGHERPHIKQIRTAAAR